MQVSGVWRSVCFGQHWKCSHRRGVGGCEDSSKLQVELGVSDNRSIVYGFSTVFYHKDTWDLVKHFIFEFPAISLQSRHIGEEPGNLMVKFPK